ncbi:MAG: HPr family phosphocarrier protein [Pirellulaceae bacterium]|nr:HPr family phosphocarrier protein [Pirellulaceae bacterium]
MRPADMLARTAAQFECLIEIEKDGQAVNCRSILDILTLGAQQGCQLFLRAAGADAQQAVDTLSELFENGFDDSSVASSQTG